MTSALKRALLGVETNISPRLSPDGSAVAFVRATDGGDAVWLVDGSGPPRPAASYDGHLVRDLSWSPGGEHLIYRLAPRGREAWALAAYDVTDGRAVTLCPGPVTGYWVSETGVVYSVREPESKGTRLYRLTLADPAPEPYGGPNPGFHQWLIDHALRPRGGVRLLRDGSAQVTVHGRGSGPVTGLTIPADARADLSVQGFDADDRFLYLLTSSEAPTRRLVRVDTDTGDVSTIFQDDALDLGSYPIGPDGVWFHPPTGTPDMCSVFGQRLRHIPLTRSMTDRMRRLGARIPGDPVILDRSADDGVWLTVVVRDDGPLEYLRYIPETGAVTSLFVNRPDLPPQPMPHLESFCFDASDGCPIGGYRLAPHDAPRSAPTVVIVHGGPAGRDYWRFNANAQYLAAIGHASLHLNFRGSKGRGKAFRLAGDGEWGGRMQDDLYDGVAHGIERGLVDPSNIAFFGASFGGYATLLAATTRPDLVRCAIAISPQCDLVRLASKPPAFWGPIAGPLRRQMLGGSAPEESDRLLRERSPRHRLTAGCPPLLIAHGARDPRIAIDEVDEFVAEARALGVAVTYLRFDDEGHHIRSKPNRALLYEEIESFLEKHVHVT